jgi:pilus assembly protein CpaE
MMTLTMVGSDRQLEQMLRAGGREVTVSDPDRLGTLAQSTAMAPDVLVADLRAARGLPPALALIKRQWPNTGVVLVVGALEPALLLEAMRAGVSEVVAEPLTSGDLERAIARVAGQLGASEPGKVFGFIGAKGGIGKTTIAANVAVALGERDPSGRTLLIDVHPSGGNAALFFGAEPRYSVVDALANTERLDTSFFGGLVTPVTAHVDLLAAPDGFSNSRFVSAKLRALIDFAAATYRYTLLDLAGSDLVLLESLDRVDALVVVVNQDVATVKAATWIVGLLRQRYGAEKVLLVLNRADRYSEIRLEDVERACGIDVAHTFPSDYKRALHALNMGRPLVLEGTSPLADSLRDFSARLAGDPIEAAVAPARWRGLRPLTRVAK